VPRIDLGSACEFIEEVASASPLRRLFQGLLKGKGVCALGGVPGSTALQGTLQRLGAGSAHARRVHACIQVVYAARMGPGFWPASKGHAQGLMYNLCL